MAKASKKKMQQNKLIALIVGIIAIVLIAIIVVVMTKGGSEETEPAVDEAVAEEETVSHDSGKSYLTGLDLDEEKVARRPVAVMIPNDSSATHCGISDAGVIFEAEAEGGITRIMAIFDDWDDLDQIGCVRSARPYYVHLAQEFNAMLVHYGYSIHAQVLIDDEKAIDNINGLKSNYFYRSFGTAPNNAYTSADLINDAISTYGYDTSYDSDYEGKFTFAADGESNALSDGDDCQVMKLYYSNRNARFEYDEETGLYTHYQWGEVHTDEANGEPVTCTNVIFQNVSHTMYEETKYINIEQIGSGEGKFFTNGKMIDITWQKDSYDDITRYYDASGNEIVLNPGVTYICYIDETGVDSNKYYATVDEYNSAK